MRYVVTQMIWDMDRWFILEYPPHSDEYFINSTYPTKEEAEKALKDIK